MYVKNNLTLEGRKLRYKTFSPDRYGRLSLAIDVTEEEKEAYIAAGWREKNFKYTSRYENDPDDSGILYMNVSIDYTYSEKKNNPALAPTIILVKSDGSQVKLTKAALAGLSDIPNDKFGLVDIIARPYNRRDQTAGVWMGADPQVDSMWITLDREYEMNIDRESRMREKYNQSNFHITDQSSTF